MGEVVNRERVVVKEFTIYGFTYKKGDRIKLSDSLLLKFKDYLKNEKPDKKDS